MRLTKPNLWKIPGFDPYALMRPFLFRLDPENAHKLALALLKKGLGPKVAPADDKILHIHIAGLDFRNPIGLAAGFDKNAAVINELLGCGFGFVEIGTITPKPQPGNPRPRLFRITEARAAINRLGFNSEGMDICLQRIKAWYDEGRRPKSGIQRGLIGINLGKNKDSTDAAADYVAGYKKLASYADYITINISSPNTPGLRDLQGREQLAALLKQVTDARSAETHKPPIFVKIAPDLDETQQKDIAEVVLASEVQGMIIGNTTTARPSNLPPQLAKEAGGLSGVPLFGPSTRVLGNMYKLTQGKLPLIGAGGVSSGADAYAKIRAGASLVQIYTSLIFEGPGIVRRIKRDLAALLKLDGFKSVSEAVGTGQK